MPKWLLVPILAVASTSVAIAMVVSAIWPKWSLPDVPTSTLIAVGAVALLAIYAVGQLLSRTRPISLGSRPSPLADVSSADVDALARNTGGTGAQYQFFLKALLLPNDVFSRISERVEHASRSVKTTGSYSVVIPPPPKPTRRQRKEAAAAPSDYLLPLFVPSRHEITSGLRIADGGGKRLSTVDSRRVALYIALCLRHLLRPLGRRTLEQYTDPSHGLENDLLRTLTRTGTIEESEIDRLRTALAALCGRDDTLADVAANVVELVLRQQVIAVPVPHEDVDERAWPWTHRFTVESSVVAVNELPSPGTPRLQQRLVRLLDMLRLGLGVPPLRLYLLPTNAVRTPSYHAELAGPEGTYFTDFSIYSADATNATGADITYQDRRGQRRTHIYIRSVAWDRTPTLVTSFTERAPGSFASTSITSIVAAIILGLLSHHELELAGKALQQAWLLPSLLAVPVAAVGLAGLDGGRASRHPSLLSRALNLGTVMLCLTGFVAATLNTGSFTTPDVVWVLLREAIAALAVVSTLTFVMRLIVEFYFTRKSGEKR